VVAVAGIFESVVAFFETSIGTAIAWAGVLGLFLFLASKLNPIQAAWKAYEGTIISAIKATEKAIPDSSVGGMAKLDQALRFVLRGYREANRGESASDKMMESLRQGIQITHDKLEAEGTLKAAPPPKDLTT